MDRFDIALQFTLKWEGGYAENPADPGGATDEGVTQRAYNAWREASGLADRPVRDLTDAELRRVYLADYWTPAHCGAFGPALSAALFDTAVNFGVRGAIELLQRAVGVPADGVLGPVSTGGVARLGEPAAAVRLCAVRMRRRQELCAANPRLKVFLTGWLRRDAALLQLVKRSAS